MSNNTKKKARILRARLIEHRAASAKLARINNGVSNLLNIQKRISSLQETAGASKGNQAGASMLATGEMQLRLARAREAIAISREEAEAERMEAEHVRMVARQREESAAKLHSKSKDEDAVEEQRMLDANSPRVRKYKQGGELK